MAAQAEQPLYSFDIDRLRLPEDNLHISYSGLESININRSFSLPAVTIYVESEYDLTRSDFIIGESDRVVIGSVPDDLAAFDDIITGNNNDVDIKSLHSRSDISSSVFDIRYIRLSGVKYAAVTLLPVTLSQNNELLFNKLISLRSANQVCDIMNSAAAVIESLPGNFPPSSNQAFKAGSESGMPLGCEYVIITSELLQADFEELARYKNSCGISAAVANVDSIIRYYPGIDNAERVRNYLIDFYAAGGQYLLLGGDDAVLPVRYLFYYNTDIPPTDPMQLRPSDLYFADLDGEWDVDGDLIWGEPSDDAPDIVPELITGRLPVRTSQAVQQYIDKLIEYETNPGGGDFDYLAHSLFFSSDEMRDYPAEGQHGVIAAALPPHIVADTITGVETPSGDNPAPTNADGSECIQKISDGYGFIHILAHGRTDGYVVRSANYGDWPASLMLTTSQENNDHGSFLDLEPNNRVSLYYSLACDNGGYELDSLDGESSQASLVENLISAEAAGAVGMVAYTRWGWVYSSYFLQKSFTENLYGPADRSPVRAMYYSWLEYPFYRDLIYGQNYYGDPTLEIYADVPSRTSIALQPDYNFAAVTVTAESIPLAGAAITVSCDGVIIEQGMTDESGEYIISAEAEDGLTYTITAGHPGCTIGRIEHSYSISLDIDDDDDDNLMPGSCSLEQNYPNPFNPSTVIGYHIPHTSDVRLDIYNILGQLVESYHIYSQSPGYHTVRWDGYDRSGQPAASGLYFYRLTAGDFRHTRKMFLIR